MNTFDDILNELDLNVVEPVEFMEEKQASMSEPLALEIMSYLREEEDIYKISHVSQSIGIIEEAVGEEVFNDGLKSFVISAEVAGWKRDEIIDFMDKEAGVRDQLISLFRGNKADVLTRQAKKNLKRFVAADAMTAPMANAAIAAQIGTLNKKPGLLQRIGGAITGTDVHREMRLANEAKVVTALQELKGMGKAQFPGTEYLANMFGAGGKGGFTAVDPRLRKMLTVPKKTAIPDIKITPDMTNAQVLAIKGANMLEHANKAKWRNPALAGGAAFGVANMMNRDKDTDRPALTFG